MPDKGRIIYIVDDDPAVCQALSLLLRSEGFAVIVFEDGDAFLDAATEGLAFGCVLLDLWMPGRNGLMIHREMMERRLAHPIVMITADGDVPLAVRAVKNGVSDFLEKPFSGDSILQAIEAALIGASDANSTNDEAVEATRRIATLSAREAEVMQGVVAGRQNKEIARDLGISPRTVETYRSNVIAKLGVRNLPEIVRMAIAAGMEAGP